MKKALIALCLGLCSFSVFAENAPVRVKSYIASGNWYAGPYYPRISVTALTDAVVVKTLRLTGEIVSIFPKRPGSPFDSVSATLLKRRSSQKTGEPNVMSLKSLLIPIRAYGNSGWSNH